MNSIHALASKQKTIVNLALALLMVGPALAASEISQDNPDNWKYFNPKHSKGEVIPSSSLIPNQGMFYPDGPPAFPHDPSKRSIVYGGGKKHHPTELYAKAFDPVQIEGKLFVAPNAGKHLDVTLSDKTTVRVWGTTFYTPISDTSCTENILGVSPFDPDRTFFTGQHQLSAVIYGDPHTAILLHGRYFGFPDGGATRKIPAGGRVITLVGILKGVPQPNLKKDPIKDIEDRDEQSEAGSSKEPQKGFKPRGPKNTDSRNFPAKK